MCVRGGSDTVEQGRVDVVLSAGKSGIDLESKAG